VAFGDDGGLVERSDSERRRTSSTSCWSVVCMSSKLEARRRVFRWDMSIWRSRRSTRSGGSDSLVCSTSSIKASMDWRTVEGRAVAVGGRCSVGMSWCYCRQQYWCQDLCGWNFQTLIFMDLIQNTMFLITDSGCVSSASARASRSWICSLKLHVWGGWAMWEDPLSSFLLCSSLLCVAARFFA